MKKIYYKGEFYSCKVIGHVVGKRQFLLYKNDLFTHFVEEEELNNDRTFVGKIFNIYYRTMVDKQPSVLDQIRSVE